MPLRLRYHYMFGASSGWNSRVIDSHAIPCILSMQKRWSVYQLAQVLAGVCIGVEVCIGARTPLQDLTDPSIRSVSIDRAIQVSSSCYLLSPFERMSDSYKGNPVCQRAPAGSRSDSGQMTILQFLLNAVYLFRLFITRSFSKRIPRCSSHLHPPPPFSSTFLQSF